jgi:amphiphysin
VIGRVIAFREVLKGVDRTITKRHHKQLDYDRFRSSLTKLKNKAEKTISEEKQVYKVYDSYL